MENKELLRVVFYVIDDFHNEHFFRKSHIGYMTLEQYDTAQKSGVICFDVGGDYYAKGFPEIISK